MFCGLLGKDSVEKVRVINGIPEDEIADEIKKEPEKNNTATPMKKKDLKNLLKRFPLKTEDYQTSKNFGFIYRQRVGAKAQL